MPLIGYIMPDAVADFQHLTDLRLELDSILR
jgi:hypothetical protein